MNNSRKLSVAILGPLIDHQKSLTAMLTGHVRQLTLLPDSHSFKKNKNSLTARMKNAAGKLFSTKKNNYLDMVCQQLDESSTDVLIAYWGTNPISDVMAVKKLRPSIKIVLMVLCHPMALNSLGIKRQNWAMNKVSKVLDGIIYPNADMAMYFSKSINKDHKISDVIIPPCWPQLFQADIDLPTLQANPNVIFIGRTDLSDKTVHSADDVRPLMNDILSQNIELYHGRSNETNDNHPFRKAFKPIGQKDLIKAMSQHDAALLAYNTAVCSNDVRFRLTVPDRLITSVAAGIPIAIPTSGYNGSKSYLKDYPAIFEFENAMQLREMLLDRPRVKELKEIAWESRQLYTAEKQGNKLIEFIESV